MAKQVLQRCMQTLCLQAPFKPNSIHHAAKSSNSSLSISTLTSSVRSHDATSEGALYFTALDAAGYSHLGASMVPFPADEEFRLPDLSTIIDPPLAARALREKQQRLFKGVATLDGETYTVVDAAEFSSRGACIVAIPEEEERRSK